MSNLITAMSNLPSGIVNLINISLAIFSFMLAAISIILVVLTVWQNSKMIENATRPVISVYISKIETSKKLGYYITVKNIGSSPAKILSFSSNKNLSDLSFSKKYIPFAGIVNSTLAPGQSISSVYNYDKAIQMEDITVSVSYTSGVKTYNSDSYINFNQFHGNSTVGLPENQNHMNPESMAEQELHNMANILYSFLIKNL